MIDYVLINAYFYDCSPQTPGPFHLSLSNTSGPHPALEKMFFIV